jgi:uncharacterized membrane protein YraQ (UPF0718 family)
LYQLSQIVSIAWEAFVELLPYFALAIFIGASVDLLYLDIPARRSFRRHGLLGIFFTTCLGALSPFCSFTVIPLVRKLLRSGVPLSAIMSFWIASPAMDPPIFALTAAQIGLPLALARLLGAMTLSVGAGVFVLLLERRGMFKDVLRPMVERNARPGTSTVSCEPEPAAVMTVVAADSVSCAERSSGKTNAVAGRPGTASAAEAPNSSSCSSRCESDGDMGDDNGDNGEPWWPVARQSLRTWRNWVITGRNMVRDSVSLGKWLVFACVFFALIRVYVPTSMVTTTLGGKGLWAIPLAVFISIPLYLNGVGAIPIVGGLLMKGMASGAAVSFLLGGAITTIPAMAAVRSVVNNRVFLVYLGVGIVGSTALGYIAQAIL